MSTPYQRIMGAAREEKGVRLSVEEVRQMAKDEAIRQMAENDDEDDKRRGRKDGGGRGTMSTARRAWRVSGFGAEGVVWAETRGKARITAAGEIHEARNIPIGEALRGLRVVRDPQNDDLAGHWPTSACISMEAIDWERRNP